MISLILNRRFACSQFDPSSLGSAHKLLWDFCDSDLEQLGLPYHARRGSDKRQVTDILVPDITVTAIDKLILSKKFLPFIAKPLI